MKLTVYIAKCDISDFRQGKFVRLRETPQDGLPVTAPIDEFELVNFPQPRCMQVQWKLAAAKTGSEPRPG
jgi:hypothetical protein